MEHIIEEQSKSINKLVKANKQMSEYIETLRDENTRLRSQLAERDKEIDRVLEVHKKEVIVTGEYAQRAIDLEAETARLREQLAEATAERDAAYQMLGGRPPIRCKECELWGGAGWSQYQVGYCEGDNDPHGANDFCSRGKRGKEPDNA